MVLFPFLLVVDFAALFLRAARGDFFVAFFFLAAFVRLRGERVLLRRADVDLRLPYRPQRFVFVLDRLEPAGLTYMMGTRSLPPLEWWSG